MRKKENKEISTKDIFSGYTKDKWVQFAERIKETVMIYYPDVNYSFYFDEQKGILVLEADYWGMKSILEYPLVPLEQKDVEELLKIGRPKMIKLLQASAIKHISKNTDILFRQEVNKDGN